MTAPGVILAPSTMSASSFGWPAGDRPNLKLLRCGGGHLPPGLIGPPTVPAKTTVFNLITGLFSDRCGPHPARTAPTIGPHSRRRRAASGTVFAPQFPEYPADAAPDRDRETC